jgi:hypothetical protein
LFTRRQEDGRFNDMEPGHSSTLRRRHGELARRRVPLGWSVKKFCCDRIREYTSLFASRRVNQLGQAVNVLNY